MKTLLKIVGGIVLVLVLVVIGAYVWATVASNRILAQTFEVHSVDFPIPFPAAETVPVLEAPVDAGDAGAPPSPSVEAPAARVDPTSRAREEAIARAEHLLGARYACTECHGRNLGGGTMIDAFPIGRILGPNLTSGAGSRTRNYAASDWDRIVRHGILPDGRPALMPSEEFQRMSDQELSDIVAYIQSVPPVDNEVPAPALGPLGKVLVATGQLQLSASLIESHQALHEELPPAAEATAEFGEHLIGTCMGCHRANLAGGPIAGGDPAWPPARNLTPHADGLATWTEEQFARALREGLRPDGTALREPMSLIIPYGQRMSDTEVRAMWLYLQALPPAPTNE